MLISISVQTNTSLVLQPGIHYLDTSVSLSDLETFLIIPEDSTAQILCTNHSRFQLSGSEYISITNVEFVGCGGNEVMDIKKFVLQGVKFKGQEETATALELINTTAVIIGSTFESNKKGKLMCISRDPERGCEFKQSVGGAIIAIQSELDISQSMFKDNQADNGAVLFAEQECIINVNNSTVADNKGNYKAVVFLSESIITIRGSNFNANIAHYGPGIHSVKSYVTIEASRFENNIGGGLILEISAAVLYSESCHVTVRMSKFYNNSAKWSGVFYSNGSNVKILASTFSDNRAWFGGVLCSEDSNIKIDASQFSNNSGSWGGDGQGGVVHSKRSFIVIKGSQFFNSTADRGGGVVYSQDSIITIETSNFKGNKAVYDSPRIPPGYHGLGGVLFIYRGNITINASEFEDNHAMFEGGNVLYSTFSTIIILGSRFTKTNNTRVGALYSHDSTIIIQGSEFCNNIAVNGAVLSSTRDTVFIDSSTFYNNSANYGGVFNFGGVFNSDSSNVTINMCVFRKNYAINGAVLYVDSSTININESEFESNLATSNGILYSKSSTIVIKTSEFCENIASLQGGVLYSERSNVTLSTSDFTGNTSPVGAVIYATENSVISYSSLLVTNNSAENYALIYLTESEFYGHKNTSESGNSIFSHNLGSLVAFNSNIILKGHDTFMHTKPSQSTVDAFQEGGTITLFQSNAFFDGVCTFEYNRAENGGAILSTESKIYVNGDVMIKNNIATRNGGGVYLSYSELNCQRRSTFVLFKNTANHKGGGLHAISSPIKATSSVKFREYTGSKLHFHENKAVKGGGLSLEANAKLYILKYNSIIVSEYLNDYDTNTLATALSMEEQFMLTTRQIRVLVLMFPRRNASFKF